MNKLYVLMVSVGMCGIGAVANAATLTVASTQMINFDEMGNNAIRDEYFSPVDKNFLVDSIEVKTFKNKPDEYSEGRINPTSGQCAPFDSAVGDHCLNEAKQGEIVTLQHDKGASGVNANYGAQADDIFNFLGFYFNFNGLGNSCSGVSLGACTNFMKVTAWAIGDLDKSLFPSDPFAGKTEIDSVTWFAGLTDNNSLLKKVDGSLVTGAVDWDNTGYFADLSSLNTFKNVGLITFQSGSDANHRLDCFIVQSSNSTSSPYSGTSCGIAGTPPPPEVVPLPAGLPLILSGLAAFGIVGRRRRAA